MERYFVLKLMAKDIICNGFKTTIKLFLAILIFGSCTANRYLLTDKGADRKFLINIIKESSKYGEIQKKPVIVVNGTPYRYDNELKNNGLQVSKKEIKNVEVLKKEVGIGIYGESAKDGVLLLTTRSTNIKDSAVSDTTRLLILLGDQEITESEMEKINPLDVESIEVIKDRHKMDQYTREDYDGVIIIRLK
ncbi:MAG: hypothetical protein JXQ80_09715 [Bacteroidales bacterium]|nr:hypothetical protein [Bacteroidales bacterium]